MIVISHLLSHQREKLNKNIIVTNKSIKKAKLRKIKKVKLRKIVLISTLNNWDNYKSTWEPVSIPIISSNSNNNNSVTLTKQIIVTLTKQIVEKEKFLKK